MNRNLAYLSRCTGEQLLLLSVFRPALAPAIEQELNRRAIARHAHSPRLHAIGASRPKAA